MSILAHCYITCKCVHCRRTQHQAGGKILLALAVLWILISFSLFAVTIWEDVMALGIVNILIFKPQSFVPLYIVLIMYNILKKFNLLV